MEADKYSTGMQELQLLTWQMKHDRQINENYRDQMQTTELNDISPMLPSVSDVSQRDLSTWVAERTLDRAEDKVPSRFSTWVQGSCCSDSKQKLEEVNGDLDGILQKLQEMLASGFILAGTVHNKTYKAYFHVNSKATQTCKLKTVISCNWRKLHSE